MAFILNKVTQAMHYNRNGSVTLLQSNSLFDNEERDGDPIDEFFSVLCTFTLELVQNRARSLERRLHD